MAFTAALVFQRSAVLVAHPRDVKEERVVQPLRGVIFDGDLTVQPVPGRADEMRLNGFGDVDRTSRRYDNFGLEAFDAQLLRVRCRSEHNYGSEQDALVEQGVRAMRSVAPHRAAA